MHLDDKKALVVGAGKSGLAAALFLQQKGASVTLTDTKGFDELMPSIQGLADKGIGLALAGQYPAITNFHLVVASPGVPLTSPPLAAALATQIPVIGELELAFRFANAPMVAITGTNGKTTTTTLMGKILVEANISNLVAGNIGLPLIQQVEDYQRDDLIVAEVSSFQLETIQTFRPRVAAILNITPDHLDRHHTMENYLNAKAAIFSNQMPTDFTVLNYDDPITASLAKKTMGQVIFFSSRHTLEQGVCIQDDNIVVTMDGVATEIFPVRKLHIPGEHNLENVLAAVACSYALGIALKPLRRSLATFQGVAHRLATVAEIDGVRYVNDSKGTNPEATMRALQAFNAPIILIAGGMNKGSNFDQLARVIKERVRLLILLGQHSAQIQQAVAKVGFKQYISVATYQEAVQLAHQQAKAGEVVLLSPACASWDMFKNYQQRGDLFSQLVNSLRG